MKKKLSQEEKIKRAKIKNKVIKIINLICYVLSGLFLLISVFGIIGCNNQNKQNQNNQNENSLVVRSRNDHPNYAIDDVNIPLPVYKYTSYYKITYVAWYDVDFLTSFITICNNFTYTSYSNCITMSDLNILYGGVASGPSKDVNSYGAWGVQYLWAQSDTSIYFAKNGSTAKRINLFITDGVVSSWGWTGSTPSSTAVSTFVNYVCISTAYNMFSSLFDSYIIDTNGGYSEGYSDGYIVGNSEGYSNGYSEGFSDGYISGYSNGYNDFQDRGSTISFDSNYDWRYWFTNNIDYSTGLFEFSPNGNGATQYDYIFNVTPFDNCDHSYNAIEIIVLPIMSGNETYVVDRSIPQCKKASELFGEDYGNYCSITNIYYCYRENNSTSYRQEIYSRPLLSNVKLEIYNEINGQNVLTETRYITAFDVQQFNINPYFATLENMDNDNPVTFSTPLISNTNIYDLFSTQYASVVTGLSVGNSNIFSLFGSAFASFSSLLGIQIIPGLTLGLLMFIPLVVTIIITIIKILRK